MKNYLLSLLVLLIFLCSLEFFSGQLLVQHVDEEQQTFKVRRLDLTQLWTFQGQNMFNHFTLSAFHFMTCQHIFIITHHYSPTGYSASAGPACVRELVESGFTINLNSDHPAEPREYNLGVPPWMVVILMQVVRSTICPLIQQDLAEQWELPFYHPC